MTRLISAILLALAFACGGSDSGGSNKNVQNFLGNWPNTTLTTTITCPGQQPVSGNSNVNVPLNNGSGADLAYSSQAGCTYEFNISGTNANLVNGPVTCSTTVNGTAIQFTVTSYTLSTSDGHHLTLNASGTASSAGTSCPMAITGSGTR